MVDEQGQVLGALSQRADPDRKRVQPVEQVGPKSVLFDHAREVLVGCCDDPDIDRHVLLAAHADEAPLLHDAQDLRLYVEAELPDFVEEQHATLCRAEKAAVIMAGAGERATDVPEELAFGNSGVDRCTVDGEEWPAGSLRIERMEGAARKVPCLFRIRP